MSEYTDQRDAIEAMIAPIPGIGVVHTRPRVGDVYDHYLFDVDGVTQVRGWEIGLDEPGTEAIRQSQSHVHRIRWWAIKGWVSIIDEDATYDAIADLALAAQQALDADQTLQGSCLHHTAVQVDEPVPAFLPGGSEGVWCWAVTLRFSAYTID